MSDGIVRGLPGMDRNGPVMGEAIRFRIETIQSAQVGPDPDDTPFRIVADGLDVVMREAVRIARMAIMAEFPGPAIQNVQPAALGADPQVVRSVLHDFPDNRRRQPLADSVGCPVTGKDFALGLK